MFTTHKWSFKEIEKIAKKNGFSITKVTISEAKKLGYNNASYLMRLNPTGDRLETVESFAVTLEDAFWRMRSVASSYDIKWVH